MLDHPRDIHILELLAAGCKRREIALQLDMWPWTVRRRLKRMVRKSEADTLPQLLSWAVAAKLVRTVPPDDGLRLLTGHTGAPGDSSDNRAWKGAVNRGMSASWR